MEVLKPNRKRCVRVLFPASARVRLRDALRSARWQARAAPVLHQRSDRQRSAARKTRFLAFSIADDGGLTVTDKIDRAYAMRGLHHFYDVEDTGDEYTYCPLPDDSQTISTAGGDGGHHAQRKRPMPRGIPHRAHAATSPPD